MCPCGLSLDSLKQSASTISREARRNGGIKECRAATSDAAAWGRSRRPKWCKLAGNAYLCRAISANLIRMWSPQQIAGWLMREQTRFSRDDLPKPFYPDPWRT
jgi:IS30 family transposase